MVKTLRPGRGTFPNFLQNPWHFLLLPTPIDANMFAGNLPKSKKLRPACFKAHAGLLHNTGPDQQLCVLDTELINILSSLVLF